MELFLFKKVNVNIDLLINIWLALLITDNGSECKCCLAMTCR